MSQDLQGKVYLVTGANSGIGLEASRNFASRGATVLMLCRSAQKGQVARDAICREIAGARVQLYLADFGSLASVAPVARQILQDHPRIDVLCNNAGGANGSRKITGEGHELTLVTNHLSGYLLTRIVLPALERAATGDGPARIVFTSSYGHTISPLDFDDLNMATGYTTLRAYGRSKLMNLLTAKEIHRRFGSGNIVASSFHPGAVRTPIWGKGGILATLMGAAMYPFMISIPKGAETFIWLASSPDPDSVHAGGHYFYRCEQRRPAPFATEEAAERLWRVSEDLVREFL